MKKLIRQTISFLMVFALMASLLAVSAFAATPATKQMTDDYGIWDYVEESDGSITLVGFTAQGEKNIVVPSGIEGKVVRKLGDNLFADRSDLTMIVVPEGVKEIGNSVFKNCDRLEKVELPLTLTTIGNSAFADCDSLLEVYIPASVENFGTEIFKGSSKVEVSCGMNSEAAKYLKANKNDVANYKLVEVTPVKTPSYSPAVPATTSVTYPHPVSTPGSGKQVCYSFGLTINGMPEYVVYLNDSMPGFNVMKCVKKDQTTQRWVYDSSVNAQMANRFTLDSLWQYNGSTYVNIQPLYNISIGQQNISYSLDYDGSITVPTVTYAIHFNRSNLLPLTANHMKFDSDDNLILYSESSSLVNRVQVKNPSTYAYLRFEDGVYNSKNPDGSIATPSLVKNSDAHIFAKNLNYCGYLIHSIADIPQTASSPLRVIHDQLTVRKVYDNANYTVATHTTETDADNNAIFNNNGVFTKVVNGITVEMGMIGSSNNTNSYGLPSLSWNCYHAYKNSSGSYHAAYANLTSDKWDYNQEWHTTNGDGTTSDYKSYDTITSRNELGYRAVELNVSNANGAVAAATANFPNQAGERTGFIEDKYINDQERTNEITVVNLNTGATNSYVREEKTDSMQNHTYIGSTGKYVGWDWYWNYAKENGTDAGSTVVNNVQYYRVTEYSYDSTTGVWSKTVVDVQAKNGGEADVDFKSSATMPTNLLQDYWVHSTSYVYDESLATGADNWLEIEKFDMDNGTDIIGGDPTVVEHDNYYEFTTDANNNEVETHINYNTFVDDGTEYMCVKTEKTTDVNGNVLSQTSTATTASDAAAIATQKQSTMEIISGNSTVTDGNGNTLNQSDEKQEMINLDASVRTEVTTQDPASYANNLVNDIADGSTALAQIDGAAPVVANNDAVVHCQDASDGSPVTSVAPD